MRKERKSAAPTVLPLDDKSPTKLYYLPELGGGGGEVIWAILRRGGYEVSKKVKQVIPKICRYLTCMRFLKWGNYDAN